MADRDQPTLARRFQQLAESGEHDGFNAICGWLIRRNEGDEREIEVIKRDGEFRARITDICQQSSQRKRAAGQH